MESIPPLLCENKNYASVTTRSALPDKEITVSFPSIAASFPEAVTLIRRMVYS